MNMSDEHQNVVYTHKIYAGVDPAGTGGTCAPKISNGGTVIRHAPPPIWRRFVV